MPTRSTGGAPQRGGSAPIRGHPARPRSLKQAAESVLDGRRETFRHLASGPAAVGNPSPVAPSSERGDNSMSGQAGLKTMGPWTVQSGRRWVAMIVAGALL